MFAASRGKMGELVAPQWLTAITGLNARLLHDPAMH
jgi:hypothetical protein